MIEPHFSDLLIRFQRNHSTQDCLIKIPEKWKHLLDNGHNIGLIFMGLWEAFDVNHSLLLEKLNGYGFPLNSTTLNINASNKFNQKSMSVINSVCGRIFIVCTTGPNILPILLQYFHQGHFQLLHYLRYM